MEDLAMRKKNYVQPTIEVVKIQLAGMLAVSGTNTQGLDGDNLIYDENGGDPGNVLSNGLDLEFF
jgi:hypothetical protein